MLHKLAPLGARERAEGEHLVFGAVHELGGLLEAFGERGAHVIPLGGHLLFRRLGEDGPKGRRADHRRGSGSETKVRPSFSGSDHESAAIE